MGPGDGAENSFMRHPPPPTHTEAPAHTSILTVQNLIYTQLKTGSRHFRRMKAEARNGKHGRSIVVNQSNLGIKRLCLHLKHGNETLANYNNLKFVLGQL